MKWLIPQFGFKALLLALCVHCFHFTANAQNSFTSVGKDFYFSFIQNRVDIYGNAFFNNDGIPHTQEDDVDFIIFISNNSSNAALVSISFSGDNGPDVVCYEDFDLTREVCSSISVPFSVAVGETRAIRAIAPGNPPNESFIQPTGNGDIQLKSFHLTSSEPVTVFAESGQYKSRDVSLILPTASLGAEYFAGAYRAVPLPNNTILDPNNLPWIPCSTPTVPKNQFGGPCEFSVVAVEPNTFIMFNPTVQAKSNADEEGATCADFPANTLSPVIGPLNAGDVVQIQSDLGDLTGTKVWSVDISGNQTDVPFALFSGNMAVSLPRVGSHVDLINALDHIYEQMLPLSAWGVEYVTAPFATDPGETNSAIFQDPDVFKIVASRDATTVLVNGIDITAFLGVGVMDAGEHIQLFFVPETVSPGVINYLYRAQWTDGTNSINMLLPPEIDLLEPLYIVGSCKVMVLQYSNSKLTNDTYGDPSMMVLSPVNQAITEISFSVPPRIEGNFSNLKRDYVSIVIPCDETSLIQLEQLFPIQQTIPGTSPSFNWTPAAFNPDFCIGNISVTNDATDAASNYRLSYTNPDPSDHGFNVYVAGFNNDEGYSFAGGVNLEPCAGAIPGSTCGPATIQLHVNHDATGNSTFEWSSDPPVVFVPDNTVQDPTVTVSVTTTFSVTVADPFYCTEVCSFEVTVFPVPTVSANSTPASCTSSADGSIDLLVSGGTPTYTYQWSDNSTAEDLEAVAQGEYCVTVTDVNGCTVGVCLTVGISDVCDDADACTVDDCIEPEDCIYTPVDCDDLDPCTVDECDPQAAEPCIFTPVDCDDDHPCTDDFCAPDGECEHTLIPGCNPCDDLDIDVVVQASPRAGQLRTVDFDFIQDSHLDVKEVFWSFGDGNFYSGNPATNIYATDGIYEACVSVIFHYSDDPDFCCPADDCDQVCIGDIPHPTGLVHRNNAQNDIIIFPNPSQGIFNVNLEKLSAQNRTLQVLDVTGKLVLHYEKCNDREIIDLSSRNSGVYFIKVTADSNIFIIKIIVV